jgi:hypothetical protein
VHAARGAGLIRLPLNCPGSRRTSEAVCCMAKSACAWPRRAGAWRARWRRMPARMPSRCAASFGFMASCLHADG